ncbi:helix-turn-helix transcriptional regulator [Haladaptatus sp. ZSTT2]|uniref:helix-turn-helix transcriptional regulator n=1 Tax=Haladaptatus sp. ZSTT2 TaxID=3120515 RepID=UPI00300F61B6
MNAPVEEIEFLARSDHRVNALSALAAGPQSRDDLRTITGASNATVGRLLNEFDSRTWIKRVDRRYELTLLGELIADGFFNLVERFETERTIRDVWQWIPFDQMGIGIECLSDATVTQATENNPLAVMSRVREFERRTTETQCFADYFPEPCIDTRSATIEAGTQRFEAVFTPSVVTTVMSSKWASQFTEMVASERTEISIFPGEISYAAGINDGVAYLVVEDDEDNIVGLVETDDERVVGWVKGRFEAFRRDSTVLTTDALLSLRKEEYNPRTV